MQPQKEQARQPEVAQSNIVLLVPSSGHYAAIGKKIVSGANLAVRELGTKKRKVSLKVIRTEGNWVQQLGSLPANYVVVGGPLQNSTLKQAQTAGLTQSRAFFTFLGRLDNGVEGSQAWRFFPSADDQIEAVVKLADDLGVRSMASIITSGAAGQRMESLLEKKLGTKGILLHKANYQSGDVIALNQAVNNLSANEQFDAVFLSCSWKQMDGVIASFDAMGRQGIVLFGTMTWDSYLNNRGVNAPAHLFPAFPSAYASTMAPKALAGGYDYWAALGYDFVRFADRMNLSSRLPSAQVTERARRASRMTFAMAPISYDSYGRAHEKLFMLQPGAQGAVLLNREDVQARRKALLESGEMDAIPSMTNDDGTLSPATVDASGETPADGAIPGQAATQAPATQAAPTNVKPYSSYKLRLPGAK